MEKKCKIYLIFVLLLLSVSNLHSQTELLTQELAYTRMDYRFFMGMHRSYLGFSFFYDWQNFPNAANKYWLSNMQKMGLDVRIFLYPWLLDGSWLSNHYGKINSPYQIPAFQSTKINEYSSGSFVSLSVFPLPYIPEFKRIQEYISPYVGIGYQWESLYGWAFAPYDQGHYKLNLSSCYWKAGCNIFLGDFVPFDLFVEYAHTLNPDKIRNYEWLRIGITYRYTDIFKYFNSTFYKSYSKSLYLK